MTALLVFLIHHQVIIPLGLAAAACNITGNYIGSGLVMKNGARIVRPMIIVVLFLLFIRVLSSLL